MEGAFKWTDIIGFATKMLAELRESPTKEAASMSEESSVYHQAKCISPRWSDGEAADSPTDITEADGVGGLHTDLASV